MAPVLDFAETFALEVLSRARTLLRPRLSPAMEAKVVVFAFQFGFQIACRHFERKRFVPRKQSDELSLWDWVFVPRRPPTVSGELGKMHNALVYHEQLKSCIPCRIPYGCDSERRVMRSRRAATNWVAKEEGRFLGLLRCSNYGHGWYRTNDLYSVNVALSP